MTITSNTSDSTVGERLHYLLLRMAGRVPDDLISEARDWLADDQVVDVAQALAFGCVSSEVTLTDDDVSLLAEVLTRAEAETDILEEIQLGQEDSYPPYSMAPVGPHALADYDNEDDIPVCLDLTGDYIDHEGPDDVDRVAVRIADQTSQTTSLVGMWRAWRYPSTVSPWSEAKRVFLMEVDAQIPGERLPGITAGVQAALVAAGETDPQVEVVQEGDDEPVYQTWVRGYGALLWASTPPKMVQVARSFDRVEADTGPVFDSDHPTIDDEGERSRILEYLEQGKLLLITTSLMPDILDSAQPPVVPVNLRTDGHWIWADTAAYFLSHHQVAPDPDLLDHIHTHGFIHPEVNSVDLYRAMVVLQGPSNQDVVWYI